ncbi:MAG TPA: NAD(P)/FAD-dependent oxidoreductase [Candidatus Binatia bacterium]|nr:NAD(P)/FAD-dependent oxidoreductase [Candidatus Binatia bacterium]
MAELTHVVILGAGFAGIGALKKLRDADVRITIIDKHDYHTFQPLLYQVATDELGPTEVGFPVRELLHGHKNITFHQTTVQSIDLARKQLTVEGTGPIQYDYLVLALGGIVNFFHTPGADQHALPLYTMEDAIRLKEHILKTFEAVDKNPALIDDGALNFCVVGGGPTGVELAGALVELLRAELKADYPNLPVDKAQVLLYEHSPNLLGTFAPKLESYARTALEERGVKVQTGTGVAKIGPASIDLSNGATVKTHTTVWAAGLQANPVVKSLGVELVHGGRIPVGPDLQIKGHPGVFAIGDIAAMTDGKTGKVVPGLGATALQAGRHVAATIKHLLDGKQPEPFEYFNKGTMAQVGRGAAVVELPTGGTLKGHLAWLAWLGVHLALLNGAEEKASIFVDWGWTILTHKRGKRIMLGDEDVA